MKKRWLLHLYPKEWRARYGDEFADLIERRRMTPALIADIVSGAIDARILRCESAVAIVVLLIFCSLWFSLSVLIGQTPATVSFQPAALGAIFATGWAIRTKRVHSNAAKATLMAAAITALWTVSFAVAWIVVRLA